MKRKGVGPRALGSPFKQTTKQYPDLPPAWKSDAAKSNYKQHSDMPAPMSSNDIMGALRHKKDVTGTGGIKVDNTIESSIIGGAALKGIKGAFTGPKPAFTLSGNKPSALEKAATTIGTMFGDEVVVGGAEYIAEELSSNNRNKKKNKK